MAQYAVPTGDISDGTWVTDGGGSDLSAQVDNGIINGTPNDTTYITENGSFMPTDCDLALSGLSDPSNHNDHVLRIRARHDGGFNSSFYSLAYNLYEGASLIAGFSANPSDGLSTTWTTFSGTLSTSEAGNISDYTALSVRLQANTFNTADAVRVSEIELEVPDAGGGGGGEPPKLHPEFFLSLL
jgi:hypothetical protein